MLQIKISILRENDEVLVRFDQENPYGNMESLNKHMIEWISGKRVRVEQPEDGNCSLQLRVPCGKINEVNACL
ncbi:hypothetical protein D3C76_1792970 [compost metagenome]